jgi:hypothetical protein
MTQTKAPHTDRPQLGDASGQLETQTDEERKFEEYLQSQSAIRDILYMYRELVRFWRGLYEDFGWEDGTFDPLSYIDISDDTGLDSDDLRLLREGSAIKILCNMLLAYGQGGYPAHNSYFMQSVKDAYVAGRFHLVPELEAAVGLGLQSEIALRDRSQDIYRKYVFAYFADLVQDNSPKAL